MPACAKYSVAVEINAKAWRLDLDSRWRQRALELRCMMNINPDAHSTRETYLTRWGVEMARKGGVPASRVLNFLGVRELRAHLEKRKTSSSRRVH
jgi:DNA polymerase (family X)